MAWMARIPRSRGAVSGVLLILLGAWGALVPFVGSYFGYAYTRAPGRARVPRSSMTTCRPRKPRTRLPRAARRPPRRARARTPAVSWPARATRPGGRATFRHGGTTSQGDGASPGRAVFAGSPPGVPG